MQVVTPQTVIISAKCNTNAKRNKSHRGDYWVAGSSTDFSKLEESP